MYFFALFNLSFMEFFEKLSCHENFHFFIFLFGFDFLNLYDISHKVRKTYIFWAKKVN